MCGFHHVSWQHGRRMDLIAELDARGLVHDTTDRNALAARLAKGNIGLYIGFDPTAALTLRSTTGPATFGYVGIGKSIAVPEVYTFTVDGVLGMYG